jgi:quinol monooxygenase YgiN
MSDEAQNGAHERWSSLRCGKLRARPGRRDALVAVLKRHAQQLRAAGCELYDVSPSHDDPDVVWVTEAWPSADARLASLALPMVKRTVAEAGALLAGDLEPAELAGAGA